nr:MAG TPA: hypothetical protein [Caudoviricetes sp.]
MADTFKGIITADGKKRQLPYRNVMETPVSDKTLSVEGGFADAKIVGDKFAKANETTDLLREDLGDITSDIYTYEELKININTDILTQKNGYYAGPSGFQQNSSYKSFYFVASSAFDCYLNEMEFNYFSICLYKNGEINSSNFVSRYRKNGNSENNLPTIDSKLNVPKGYAFVISTTTGVTAFEILTSLEQKTGNTIHELQSNDFVKIKKDAEKITIQQRNLIYEFMRDTNSGINLDTWRIKNYIVNGIYYKDVEIEGVIKQKDSVDFVGGYHGDEKYISINIYVDGVNIGENENIEEKYVKRITILLESEVYFCNTSTKAFTRYKQLDFFKNTLRITNKWIYVGDVSFIVQRYPCGMFSMNTSDIYGYTTNFTPFLQNNIEAPSKQSIDKVEFYGDGFVVCVKYVGEKDKEYYRGTVSYFSSETPTRMKAYLMGIYEYQSTRTLSKNDTIESEVEVSCY